MKSIGRVIALTKYSKMGASSRVRFWNLIPGLEARGWDIDVVPLLSDEVLTKFYARGTHSYGVLAKFLFRRVVDLIQVGSPQILWVEKEAMHGFPLILESLLIGSRMPSAVFDFDDSVYLNYTDNSLGRLGRSAKFPYYGRNAGYVTVGSESLGADMMKWGCSNIKKIPSTVSVGHYFPHVHRPSSTIVIGWIGTPKTVRFLDELRLVIPTLARRFPIQMHVVGAKWECQGVEVISLPWSEDTETAMVSRFDIGVMPLSDGPWERAKCGYKLIQYMAAGVVPMGARVGENMIIIQDGLNGYLASQAEEWIEKLSLLCANAQLRSEVGARARETALAKYDVRIAVEAVHGVFAEVVSRQTRRSQ